MMSTRSFVSLRPGHNKGNDPHDTRRPSPIGYAQSAGAIVAVTPVFGADGPAAGGGVNFAIDVPGITPGGSSVSSGLFTTEGQEIRLFEINSQLIVGRYDGPDGGSSVGTSDPAAFAIHIDAATGVVTVVQYVSIKHDDRGDPDEVNDNGNNTNDALPDDPLTVQQWLNNGALRVTATVTDGDGDSVSQAYEIGNKIVFQDDGPTVSIIAAAGTVAHDETPGDDPDAQDTSAAAVANLFSGVTNTGNDPHVAGAGAIGYAQSAGSLVTTTVAFGVDGPATSNAQVLSLAINGGNNTDSGLNTTEGLNILLRLENGLIVGRVDGDNNGSVSGSDPAAFAIAIGSDGKVSVAQYLSIEHGNTASFDESVSIALNKVLAQITATDGDGDTATATVDISQQITFQDDGPQILGVQVTIGPDLIVNGSFEQGHSLGQHVGDIPLHHGMDLQRQRHAGRPERRHSVRGADRHAGDLAAQRRQCQGRTRFRYLKAIPSITIAGDINANDTNAIIQQTVGATVDGQTYELTFWYAPRPNDGDHDSSSMKVLWNGQVVK